MRTREQLMHEYLKSHRHPVNALLHMICVPVIVFSTLGLAWCVPIGSWLRLPADIAPYANLATVAALPLGVFYWRLSVGSLLTMAVWFLASIAGVLAIQAAGWPLLTLSAMLWVLSWALQIHGHRIEGAKPSAADDVVFFLVGPLFVTDKLRKHA